MTASQLLTPITHTPYEHKCCTILNIYDIVSSIAIPILLAASIGLTVYFSINSIHATPITSTFSASIPLLITILAIQIVRYKDVIHSWIKPFRPLLRIAVHPGKRGNRETVEGYKERNIEHLRHFYSCGFDQVNFITRDEIKLGGLWKFTDKDKPTVILFYGNTMTAVRAIENYWGEYYANKGYNVLVPDYRGYGLSKGKAATYNQEMQAYYDTEACLKFVLEQGVSKENIIGHGTSLGGPYATALSYFFGIKKVVLDHTFTSCGDVAANIVPILPRYIAYLAIQYIYEQREMPSQRFGVRPLKTDGFNSLKKVRHMSGRILVIRGKKDKLMNMRFGEQLVAAKYKEEKEQKQHLITVDGGHNGYYFDLIENYNEKLELFLE